MASYETSSAAPFGAIAAYRLIKTVADGIDAVAAWNDRRMTRKALSKLTDRELDDIGLCRGDVEMIGR